MKIDAVNTLRLKTSRKRPIGLPKLRGRYVANTNTVQLRVHAQTQVRDEQDYLRLLAVGLIFPYESTLPCQFFADPNWSGPKQLMAAVLRDAILVCQFKRSVVTSHQSSRRFQVRLANEAAEWLRSEDTEWPFSFLNICEELHLNAGQVRAGVGVSHEPLPSFAGPEAVHG